MFEVDGVKYVPVSPSERTCDAIDCIYGDEATDVTIGETVTYRGIQMAVKRVHKYACYQNSYIENVEIGLNGNVEDYAFQGCSNLSQAIIKNSGAIGSYAFQNCTALTTATLGDAVTNIGDYSFDGCSNLEGIVIPDAVTSLGQYSFQNCSKMAFAKIGTAVQTIGYSAFSDCSSLPEIEIPQSVTSISNSVFNGCTAMKNVLIADRSTILLLGSNGSDPLFSSCPLDSVYIGGKLSYSTTDDKGYSPFYNNTSLRAVMITDKETEISENEFYGCTSLKNVYIGDGVTTIGNWAFSGCSSLDYFAFGSSVTSIGQEAFSDCESVKEIISKAEIPPTCGTNALNDIYKWDCTLYVPKGCLATYKAAEQWKDFFFFKEFEVVIPGDANYDKIVDFADVLAVINYILYGEGYSDQFFANRADMNDDGEITISDAVAILNIILDNTTPPFNIHYYYRNADGKTGAELKTVLCGIIYNRTERTYSDLWNDFRSTDARSEGMIWDMYSGISNFTFGIDQDPGSGNKEGQYYTREHSWPNSWFGGKVLPMYTDLHHMYPVDKVVNNRRSNYPFGETDGESYQSAGGFSKVGKCTYPGYDGTVFEPNDEYKGDFARTYFYMVTCYEEKLSDWYEHYEDVRHTIDGTAYPALAQWQLEMLMQWAEQDPVSQKETDRNEAVYHIQGNRNPFIDYPGLEQYIWGSKMDEPFSCDYNGDN